MSLTSFLKLPDVRKRFREEIEVPRILDQRDIVAPARSNRYSLVGTAFDYLFRFHLQRLNKHAVAHPWVAEEGLARLAEPGFGGFIDINSEPFEWLPHPQFKKARLLFVRARAAHARFLKSGRLTEGLLKSSTFLAQLDFVVRAEYVDESLGHTTQKDLRDLRRLISVVPWKRFRSKRLCVLNPTFGKASRLVGGADADLLLDDILVDIKTTKTLMLRPEYLFQLVGYVILHRLGSIEGLKTKPHVSKIAIYFSRHAHLQVFELNDVISPRRLARFATWFRGKATRCYVDA